MAYITPALSSHELGLKEDDTVVVTDANTSRKNWKVGRVVRTYPSEDGLVRVVDVKVGDRILKRPVTKLSPLEMNHLDTDITALKSRYSRRFCMSFCSVVSFISFHRIPTVKNVCNSEWRKMLRIDKIDSVTGMRSV